MKTEYKWSFMNLCAHHFLRLIFFAPYWHEPRKKKYARGNHLPFMNKTLSKEIMKRTKLCNKFLKGRTDESKKRTIRITTELLCFIAKKDKKRLV